MKNNEVLTALVKRREAIKNFLDYCDLKVLKVSSQVLVYYGMGGIGKSTLLKNLMSLVDKFQDKTRKPLYIYHDFDNNLNTLQILQSLKKQLEKYGCDFPLFDTGHFFYALNTDKSGVLEHRLKTWFDNTKNGRAVKDVFENVGNIVGLFHSTAGTTIGNIPLMLSKFQTWRAGIPNAKNSSEDLSVFVEKFFQFQSDNKDLSVDDEHKNIGKKLSEANKSKNTGELYNLLPELFALDVKDWLNKEKNSEKFLVVFMDTYEVLVNKSADRPTEYGNDWWIKGNRKIRGLANVIPKTLWVIAGREELNWLENSSNKLKNCALEVFSPEESDMFLKESGFEDKQLRAEIIKRTQGYPFKLGLCADIYKDYKQKYHSEPSIKEFEDINQDVFNRIFKYMDYGMQDLIQFLCILGSWTNEIAFEIGLRALPNFSLTGCKKMKYFSFVRRRNLDFDNETEFFSFDKEIRKLLLPQCDKILMNKIKQSADDYFDEFLRNTKELDDKFLFYLNYWVYLIVLLSSDIQELKQKYDQRIAEHLTRLEKYGLFDKSTDILLRFMDKLKNENAEETAEYCFFLLKSGMIKQYQDRNEEALSLIETAYKKLLKLSGEKNSDTVTAMSSLIILLLKMRKNNLAENFRITALNLYKEICSRKLSLTHRATGNLAAALKTLKCLDEAKELQIRVLTFCKNIFGYENLDTINAMNNLAITLRDKGDFEKALNLQEKTLKLYRKIVGTESLDTALAMNNLAKTLEKLNRYEDSLEYRREVLRLYKNILSEDHKLTNIALKNFNNALSKLNRFEKIL